MCSPEKPCREPLPGDGAPGALECCERQDGPRGRGAAPPVRPQPRSAVLEQLRPTQAPLEQLHALGYRRRRGEELAWCGLWLRRLRDARRQPRVEARGPVGSRTDPLLQAPELEGRRPLLGATLRVLRLDRMRHDERPSQVVTCPARELPAERRRQAWVEAGRDRDRAGRRSQAVGKGARVRLHGRVGTERGQRRNKGLGPDAPWGAETRSAALKLSLNTVS